MPAPSQVFPATAAEVAESHVQKDPTQRIPPSPKGESLRPRKQGPLARVSRFLKDQLICHMVSFKNLSILSGQKQPYTVLNKWTGVYSIRALFVKRQPSVGMHAYIYVHDTKHTHTPVTC